MSQTLSEVLDTAITDRGEETSLTATAGDAKATVEVRDADRIGVVLEKLRVETGPGDLNHRIEALAEKLRPTGERLIPIEVAPQLGEAVLRTRPEDMRGRRFYQVDVDLNGAEISRYQVDKSGKRTAIQAPMTRDQLTELVDGLVNGLG